MLAATFLSNGEAFLFWEDSTSKYNISHTRLQRTKQTFTHIVWQAKRKGTLLGSLT